MSTAARREHLVTVLEFQELLRSGRPLVLLDVRWRLSDAPGEGSSRYQEGHLPGARFLDLESVLSRHSVDPREGRHPLPDVSTLATELAALGVRGDADVVVYDEPGTFAAERAWWVLRWAGLRARLLDGGLHAWTAAGMPVERGPGPAQVSGTQPLQLTPGQLPTLDIDETAAFPSQGVLLDARAPERYLGEVEPLDPRAGHIPGAANAPAAEMFDASGRLPDDDTLRLRFGALGTSERPVAVYCGSGVSAARDVLALAVLDVEAALFPGSWSAWSNALERPAARGREPG